MAYGTYDQGLATAASDPVNLPPVQAPGAGAGGGGYNMGEMGSFMEQMLREQYERKKKEQYLADRERERMQAQEREDRARMLADRQHQAEVAHDAQYRQGGMSHPGLGSSEGNDSIGLALKYSQADAEMQRMQAMGGQAPQKWTTSPNGWGGYTLDPGAMNAYQRQAFLPQNSSGTDITKEARKLALAKNGIGQEGDVLMAQQRAEMKSGEEKRKKLMGGGANYRGPGGGYR